MASESRGMQLASAHVHECRIEPRLENWNVSRYLSVDQQKMFGGHQIFRFNSEIARRQGWE